MSESAEAPLKGDCVRRCLQEVVSEMGWKYLMDEDSGSEEVVSLFGSGDLGNWVLISRILEEKRELLIMATTQENVPLQARKNAIEFITRANFGILNGFFDMDLEDGDCRFSSRVQFSSMDQKQLKENFKKTFQIVHGTFSKYLPGLYAIIHRGFTGKAAVDLVEGGNGVIPDENERPLLSAVAKHLSEAKTSFVYYSQKGIIRMPCNVQGMTLQLRIKALEESKNLYIFANYPKNGGKVGKSSISAELVEYISRVNWGLPFGYFDFDVDDGELKFVTWISVESTSLEDVQKYVVRTLIITCITTFVKYFSGFEDVIQGTKSAKDSISYVEGKKDVSEAENTRPSVPQSSSQASFEEPHSKQSVAADQDTSTVVNTLGKSLRDTKKKVASSVRHSLPFIANFKNRISLPPPTFPSQYLRCGVIGFLGYQLNTSKLWKNPVEKGLVYIKSTPIHHEKSIPLENTMEESPTGSVVLEECNDPSIELEFKVPIAPTHYLIEYESSGIGGALRSWRIEFSREGSSWETLRTHSDDDSLNTGKSPASCIWRLGASPKAIFRFCRIVQTDNNWSGTKHLVIRSFEIFGHVFLDGEDKQETEDTCDRDSNSSEMSFLISASDMSFKEESSDSLSKDCFGSRVKGLFCGFNVLVRHLPWNGIPQSLRDKFEKSIFTCCALICNELQSVIGLVKDDENERWMLVEEWNSFSHLGSILSDESLHTSLPYEARLKMCQSLLQGIEFLHNNGKLVHGCLIPESVLVLPDYSIQVTNFCWPMYYPKLHIMDSFVTQSFIWSAPEVLIGMEYSPAADIFSCAMLMYWILTLRFPYSDGNFEIVSGGNGNSSNIWCSTSLSNSPAILFSRILYNHLRPEIPLNLPDGIASLLHDMWDPNPSVRPSASRILSRLNVL